MKEEHISQLINAGLLVSKLEIFSISSFTNKFCQGIIIGPEVSFASWHGCGFFCTRLYIGLQFIMSRLTLPSSPRFVNLLIKTCIGFRFQTLVPCSKGSHR